MRKPVKIALWSFAAVCVVSGAVSAASGPQNTAAATTKPAAVKAAAKPKPAAAKPAPVSSDNEIYCGVFLPAAADKATDMAGEQDDVFGKLGTYMGAAMQMGKSAHTTWHTTGAVLTAAKRVERTAQGGMDAAADYDLNGVTEASDALPALLGDLNDACADYRS